MPETLTEAQLNELVNCRCTVCRWVRNMIDQEDINWPILWEQHVKCIELVEE